MKYNFSETLGKVAKKSDHWKLFIRTNRCKDKSKEKWKYMGLIEGSSKADAKEFAFQKYKNMKVTELKLDKSSAKNLGKKVATGTARGALVSGLVGGTIGGLTTGGIGFIPGAIAGAQIGSISGAVGGAVSGALISIKKDLQKSDIRVEPYVK